uniref:Uncharacterized protein n=1 Tax=Oryza meridionalis TaxID=40149 RepID=A0A0E0ES05_9ORYZ
MHLDLVASLRRICSFTPPISSRTVKSIFKVAAPLRRRDRRLGDSGDWRGESAEQSDELGGQGRFSGERVHCRPGIWSNRPPAGQQGHGQSFHVAATLFFLVTDEREGKQKGMYDMWAMVFSSFSLLYGSNCFYFLFLLAKCLCVATDKIVHKLRFYQLDLCTILHYKR